MVDDIIRKVIRNDEFKRGCLCFKCSKYPCEMSISHVCGMCKEGHGRTSACIHYNELLGDERRIEYMCTADNGAIKDSGERTQFATGAVRDMAVGKGRMDLMPIEAVAKLFHGNDKVLNCFEEYNKSKDPVCFLNAIDSFIDKYWDNYKDEKPTEGHGVIFPILLDVSIHFEQGAIKYGENNWQKGIPLGSYIDSALRHYAKSRSGMKDEHHNRAFVWNMLCAYWTAITFNE